MPSLEAHCGMRIGPYFVHVEVFNRDTKLVGVCHS